MSKIVIAVPRGRIIKECKNLLLKTSFAPDPLLFDKDTRKLTFKSKKRNIEYIKVRAFDACTFVAFGAAQIGIAGEDVINEFDYSRRKQKFVQSILGSEASILIGEYLLSISFKILTHLKIIYTFYY